MQSHIFEQLLLIINNSFLTSHNAMKTENLALAT